MSGAGDSSEMKMAIPSAMEPKMDPIERLELEIRRLRDEVTELRMELKKAETHIHYHSPPYNPPPWHYYPSWPIWTTPISVTTGVGITGTLTNIDASWNPGDDFNAGTPALV